MSAASAPPTAVLDALSRHKAEVVALLRPGPDGLSAEDWQVFFDQRAGIVEFDGGLPRAQAELQAFEWCVVEWLNRNPVPAPAEVFRYVRHAEVPSFTAEGWELLPALDGTHHGEYSVLMRRAGRKREDRSQPRMAEIGNI